MPKRIFSQNLRIFQCFIRPHPQFQAAAIVLLDADSAAGRHLASRGLGWTLSVGLCRSPAVATNGSPEAKVAHHPVRGARPAGE